MTLGEQIKAERDKQNLTQVRLASNSGISFDTIRRIEQNRSKNPSHFVVTSLEKALGIKFDI
jgi:transcriptional regulator with XRE-family HTH domain